MKIFSRCKSITYKHAQKNAREGVDFVGKFRRIFGLSAKNVKIGGEKTAPPSQFYAYRNSPVPALV